MADHLKRSTRKLLQAVANANSNSERRRLLQQLDVVLAGYVPADGGGIMKVESMVASKTKNPIVIFTWGSNKGELDPIAARGYAMQIMEASEAAIQDASLFRAIKETGGTDEQGFAMITAVRNHRGAFERGGE